MKRTFYKGVALGAAVAVLVLAATSALAGTGVGDVFNLGVDNTLVDGTTGLSGHPASGPQLKVENLAGGVAVRGSTGQGNALVGVTNKGIGVLGQHIVASGAGPGVQGETNSTDTTVGAVVGKNTGGGPGVSALVNPGAPPLAVNSTAKVKNLNADLWSGVSAFMAVPRFIGFNMPSNTAKTNIATLNNLSFFAACSSTGDTTFEIKAANASSLGERVHVTLTRPGATSAVVTYRETDSLSDSAPFDVLGPSDDDTVGTLVHESGEMAGGHAQVFSFLAEEDNGRCKLGGVLENATTANVPS